MAREWAQWVSRAPLSLAIIICIVQICYLPLARAGSNHWTEQWHLNRSNAQTYMKVWHADDVICYWGYVTPTLTEYDGISQRKKEWWHPPPPLGHLSLVINMSPSLICGSRRDLLSRYFHLHQRLLSHSDSKCHLTKLLKGRQTCL